MGFLNKGESAETKEQKLMEKYGLDSITNEKDIKSLKEITSQLFGTGIMDLGAKLNFGAKTEDILQISYQKAIVEQNFMIIRKLCEISEKLK